MEDNDIKQPDDKKPDHINIRVIGNDHTEIYFKIKKTTPLRKLMEAYCERQGKQFNSMKFLFDGKRLSPSMTAEQAGLENDDSIDAMLEQIGGFFNPILSSNCINL